MDALLRSIRYALRRLARAPGFTAVVVLTLALGIGANSTIFSVVSTLLLRPLPYPEPERLVTVNHHYGALGGMNAPVSSGNFVRYRDEARSFENAGAATPDAANLNVDGSPERVSGARVSAGFFEVFGTAPLHGRVLTAEEDVPGRDHVVVLSHGFWQRAFGADAAVVGRTLSLDGVEHQIIGVMPASFQFFWSREAEIFRPLALTPEQLAAGGTYEWLSFAGRLAPGVTLADAQREMTAFATRLRAEDPGEYPNSWTLAVRSLNEVQKADLRTPVFILFAAVGIVLLIACANVANLMLARSTARSREIAIRSSLGAGRKHLITQLVTEAVILALAGGVIGILIAFWSVEALGSALADELPGIELGVDASVLAFTLLISIGTGLIFGLIPAFQASRPDIQGVIREGSRGITGDRLGHAMRRALVVGEVAIALTLLTGAGLLIRSLSALQQVDPGFETSNLLTFDLALPAGKYPEAAQRAAFYERALSQLRSTPGISAVGLTTVLPFGDDWATGGFSVEGFQPPAQEQRPWGDLRSVSPGYDRALGLTVLRGRFFNDQDRADSPPVALVDEELVRRYWPNVDPIGKRVTLDDGADPDAEWVTVVGVVRHTKHAGLNDQDRVQLYFPLAQGGDVSSATVAVRTTGDPLSVVGSVRAAIRAIDPEQPIAKLRTMDALVDQSLGGRKLSVRLLSLFSALAALLSALGIYGVISNIVAQRTRELGVRMALGAAAEKVLVMVLRQGVGLALAGIGLGLIGAFALTRLISSQLFGVAPTDPLTFAATAILLLLVATIATLLPAGRAARVDPMIALRAE